MRRITRWTLVACLWIVPATLFAFAFSRGWEPVWKSVGVSSMSPPFLDLRGLTTGLKVEQQGGDPLVANPLDPSKRPLNYPRIWLRLFKFAGLNDQNIIIVGLLFCGLYLAVGSCLILQSKDNWEALLMLAASLSIAGLLAMERGNTDLSIFFLVFLGCAMRPRTGRPFALFVASILKIYPFAALIASGIRGPRKQRILAVVLAVVTMVIFAWQWRDLSAIRKATPMAANLSYGVLTLKDYFWILLVRTGVLKNPTIVLASTLTVAYCWAVGLLVVVNAWKKAKLQDFVPESREGDLFFVFGAVYAFTFAIGSNWDYRLIFLIPTLPMAVEFIRSRKRRTWGILYIVCVLVAENGELL